MHTSLFLFITQLSDIAEPKYLSKKKVIKRAFGCTFNIGHFRCFIQPISETFKTLSVKDKWLPSKYFKIFCK